MAVQNTRVQDNRLFTRYPTKESCAVMLTPGHIISFCILDISKSGLAFCYDGRVNESKMLSNVAVTLFTEDDISPDIPVQIISDTEISEENLNPPHAKSIAYNRYLRRCGLKFQSLSQSQEEMINGYIQNLEAN
jgi:hypothetical protein